MKNIIKIIFVALLIFNLASSCKKEAAIHADLSALDRDTIVNTALDNWLDANYLKPYNIQVKYRWDPYEADLDKDLTPPKEALVQPSMEAVRDIWIKPYEQVGGQYFMIYNTPKQFYLVGSPSYNGDGTITLGTAEGGKKIVLYVINNFVKTNTSNLVSMMHVIHHEYTHILNQKYPYDPAFGLVTQSDYTANWNIPNTATARSLGFITQYSRSNPIEDFAEMTSNMLTIGKPRYDFVVNSLPATPQAELRKKEQFVVNYFKSAWNIDFYALQTAVATAINNTTGSPATLSSAIGTGKVYTSFSSLPSTDPGQSTEFLGLWNAAKTLITGQGYTLTQFSITFGAGTLATVRYTFNNATTTYYADADYNMVTDATTGNTKFTLVTPQPTSTTYGNWTFVKTSMAGVNNYLVNNSFKLAYPANSIFGVYSDNGNLLPGGLGYFTKSTDPTSYIFGQFN